MNGSFHNLHRLSYVLRARTNPEQTHEHPHSHTHTRRNALKYNQKPKDTSWSEHAPNEATAQAHTQHILLENFVIDLSLDFKHSDNGIISFDMSDEITARNFFARFKLKYVYGWAGAGMGLQCLRPAMNVPSAVHVPHSFSLSPPSLCLNLCAAILRALWPGARVGVSAIADCEEATSS